MSNRKRFAQVHHQKWDTVSKSLRSLTKNEQMSKWLVYFEQIAHSRIFLQKKSDSLRKSMSKFPTLQKRKSKFPTLQKMFKINIFGSMLELQSLFSEPMAQVIKQPLKVKFLN